MKSQLASSYAASAALAVDEIREKIAGVPKGIIFYCNYSWIEQVTESLKMAYPDTEIIGTSGIWYHDDTVDENKGLTVTALMDGCEVRAGVIKHLATVPLSDVIHLDTAVKELRPSGSDSVIFEFCTNDEEVLVSTIHMQLDQTQLPLLGGTVYGTPEGSESKVSVNGRVYTNACSFILIKNTTGRVYTAKETIYGADQDAVAHVATRVDLTQKRLIELDHRPAAEVYSDETGVARSDIIGNVLNSPLGRVIEDDVFIASMKEIGSDGSMACYKRINLNDRIRFLKLLDYKRINQDTFDETRRQIPSPSLVLSVNCIYRYTLFSQQGYMSEYLRGLKQGALVSAGYVGGGEQYNTQHVNQTMVMAVFE
ncbi:MAG: FIST N-terminal domain-containing protein [Lachnospiraceae bacterium]|nr:FIST N-terminal domain-containing protein [Lachnospiraceae bacterium]